MSPPTDTVVRRSSGFTLTEVMVTVGILGLLLGGLIPFFTANFRYLFTAEQKLLINADIRNLTNEMVEMARASNFFVLYESFYDQTIDGTLRRRDANGNGTVNLNDRRQAGEAGSLLVFVYYEDPYFDERFYDGDPSTTPLIQDIRVNRVVAYWTAPNNRITGEYAMYRLDTERYRGVGATWTTPWGLTLPLSLAAGGATVESLLPAATEAWATSTEHQLVVNDLAGLGAGGLSFINFQNRSVLVRLKILHGNRAKRVTNTYNFTVTPRG